MYIYVYMYTNHKLGSFGLATSLVVTSLFVYQGLFGPYTYIYIIYIYIYRFAVRIVTYIYIYIHVCNRCLLPPPPPAPPQTYILSVYDLRCVSNIANTSDHLGVSKSKSKILTPSSILQELTSFSIQQPFHLLKIWFCCFSLVGFTVSFSLLDQGS